MIVLYNSDSFAVMQVDLPAEPAAPGHVAVGGRSGLEIVDKAARKGIFLDGALAASFMAGVQALARQTSDVDDIDAHLALYTGHSDEAWQPMALH
jgi:hypothetical protein